MDDMKTWYRSKTVWGALIAILAPLVRYAGLELGAAEQEEIVNAIMTIVATAGGLLALYGRIAARAAIGKR